jgi:hypothetical protein
MAVCPICQKEFDATRSGQLCSKCRDEVLAKDVYTQQDLRFVGLLAGVLTAAIASMPGALIGDVIGRSFGNGGRGTTTGVIVFSLMGLAIGFFAGRSVVKKMEAAKRGV